MSNFTPGPWKSTEMSIWGADPTNAGIIASTFCANKNNIENRANAALIAAAPDLFGACEQAHNYLCRQNLSSEILKELAEALAKARGES